ncbi:hypothetical protein GCM10009738_53410 [Kitasatospora viridis]
MPWQPVSGTPPPVPLAPRPCPAEELLAYPYDCGCVNGSPAPGSAAAAQQWANCPFCEGSGTGKPALSCEIAER